MEEGGRVWEAWERSGEGCVACAYAAAAPVRVLVPVGCTLPAMVSPPAAGCTLRLPCTVPHCCMLCLLCLPHPSLAAALRTLYPQILQPAPPSSPPSPRRWTQRSLRSQMSLMTTRMATCGAQMRTSEEREGIEEPAGGGGGGGRLLGVLCVWEVPCRVPSSSCKQLSLGFLGRPLAGVLCLLPACLALSLPGAQPAPQPAPAGSHGLV